MKNKVTIIILVILYRLLLDLSYYIYVSPLFAYQGFVINFNSSKYLLSIFILLIMALMYLNESKKFSVSIMSILFLFMIVPFTSLYGLEDLTTTFFWMIIFGFVITNIVVRNRTILTPHIKSSLTIIKVIVLVNTILVLGMFFLLNGIPNFKNFNILNVYETRSSVNYGSGIFPYLFWWQVRVVNPYLIGYGVWNKKRNFLFIGIILQVLIYLYTGHKSILFTPIVVIFVVYLFSKSKLIKGTLVGLISVIIVSMITLKYYDNDVISSLFIRRTLFVPAKNYYFYYDFFSENEFMLFAHSILSPFIENPYNIAIPNLIGSIYYNNEKTWVNVGYLADGYMNFGFIGIILSSILLGLILKAFDSLAVKVGVEMVFIVSFMGFFSLNSGALLTTLLTGGIFPAYILLSFIKKE